MYSFTVNGEQDDVITKNVDLTLEFRDGNVCLCSNGVPILQVNKFTGVLNFLKLDRNQQEACGLCIGGQIVAYTYD